MANPNSPSITILAGPNGAGKSTIAERLFPDALGIGHFVNADTLARGLSAFHFDDMALKAGRIMLAHLEDLASQRLDFAFETTLAGKVYAAHLREWKDLGYRFSLFYVWVPSSDVCVERVRRRVEQGGHGIPEETIHRRYKRGFENFFRLFMPLADEWQFVDNSNPEEPRVIAQETDKVTIEHDPILWRAIKSKVLS